GAAAGASGAACCTNGDSTGAGGMGNTRSADAVLPARLTKPASPAATPALRTRQRRALSVIACVLRQRFEAVCCRTSGADCIHAAGAETRISTHLESSSDLPATE